MRPFSLVPETMIESLVASWDLASVLTVGTVSALEFIVATTMSFASNDQVVSCLLTLVGQAEINDLLLDEIVLVTRFV